MSHLEIAGTMHLSEVSAPAGVELLDDLEETIVATITAPTEIVKRYEEMIACEEKPLVFTEPVKDDTAP